MNHLCAMVQRGSKGIPDLIRMGIFLADITLFTQINVTWSLICRLLVEINSILPGLERVVILMNLPTDLPDRRKLLRLEELDGFPPFGTWKSHFSPILGRCLQEKKLKHPLYPLKQCDFIDFIVLGAFSSCFHRFPLGLPRISPSVPRSQLLDVRKTSDPRQGPLIEFAVKSQQGEFFIRKARDA